MRRSASLLLDVTDGRDRNNLASGHPTVFRRRAKVEPFRHTGALNSLNQLWSRADATERKIMPEKKTIEKAKRDLRQGKSPSTAAGEFVHEEIEHVREGKHGARSTKQAIAIGLSKARRAGVP